jgi:hypothetical protein
MKLGGCEEISQSFPACFGPEMSPNTFSSGVGLCASGAIDNINEMLQSLYREVERKQQESPVASVSYFLY